MNSILLTSLKNPKVKNAFALRDRKERDKQGVTLLEGYRELSRALAVSVPIHETFYCPDLFLGQNEPELLRQLAAAGSEMYECSKEVLCKLAYRDRPEGLIEESRF